MVGRGGRWSDKADEVKGVTELCVEKRPKETSVETSTEIGSV